MRMMLAAAALLLTTGAGTPSTPVHSAPSGSEAVCRDRIQQVRAERGLQRLDQAPQTQAEGLLIAAVDKRIDGCSVMVMRNNSADVRPLPAPAPHRLMRAR
jgi:hypothetical protein